MNETDLELLRRYGRDHAEDAFAEIVRRHLDLVYSAALRQVRSAQLAEEIAQSAFADLARIAGRLKSDTVLSAWLYQVTRRTAIDVVRREARRRLRERIASEMNAINATAADWAHIEPLLDEAMFALDDTDRAAVVLRYFENKSLREVGRTLGTSEDAAQKRVSRAVERLREFFAKRGVTVGAGGLVVLVSAHAVQAAPAGLAVTISTVVALGGTTLAATATATATPMIAMTTLQKALTAVVITAAVGTGIYEARKASSLRTQVQTLQQQQAPLAEQIQRLTRAHAEATNRLAALREDNDRLTRHTAELLKLRGEVTRLRRDSEELAGLKARDHKDPSRALVNTWLSRVDLLKQRLQQTPGANIPELQSLTEEDWFNAVKEDLKTDVDFRKALSRLRYSAETKYGYRILAAVEEFSRVNGGQRPVDLSQLKPYFKAPVDDAILQRYELVPAESLPTITMPGAGGWVITQKAAVDLEYDTRFAVAKTDGGLGYQGGGSFAESEMVKSLTPAIKAYFSANSQGTLSDPTQLAPYITTPETRAVLEGAIKWYEEASPENRAESLRRLEGFRPK